MPSIASLGLQPIFHDMCREKNGLILVTGATGSGKTTTLAAMLNEINETAGRACRHARRPDRVRPPAQEGHLQPARTRHRLSTPSRAACAPRCGRRRKSSSSAKCATARPSRSRSPRRRRAISCSSTIHTINAGQSINRILGMFDSRRGKRSSACGSRTPCAGSSASGSRRKSAAGALLVNEIMGSNLRVRETITLGEGEARSFYDIIEANATFGWTTFDQSLGRATRMAASITEETADLYATNKARMTRYIDDVKKQRGLVEEKPLGLRLDLDATATTAEALDQPPPERQMITTMETGTRLDLFEPGDLTAARLPRCAGSARHHRRPVQRDELQDPHRPLPG